VIGVSLGLSASRVTSVRYVTGQVTCLSLQDLGARWIYRHVYVDTAVRMVEAIDREPDADDVVS